MANVRVLFVCMGNICRSPMAQGVLQRDCAEAGLGDHVRIDSAGTHSYHEGRPPDERAIAAAAARDADISGLRARTIEKSDFTAFDYVICMDSTNFGSLKYLCPRDAWDRLYRLMDFAPGDKSDRDIPDPYNGHERHFERALDMIERGCGGLVERIAERHLGPARHE